MLISKLLMQVQFKRSLRFWFVFFPFLMSVIANAQNTELSVEAIVEGKFNTNSIGQFIWVNDKLGFVKSEKDSTELLYYSPNKFRKETLLSIENLGEENKKSRITKFEFSEDKTKLLLTLLKGKYRYMIYDLARKQAIPIKINMKGIGQLILSPDNNKIGFIHKTNLYVYNIVTENIEQITTIDPKKSVDINNSSLLSVKTYKWSPDSKYMAYTQEDADGVKFFTLINNTDSIYPSLNQFRYIKPGETLPEVKVGVVDLSNKKTQWIKSVNNNRDHYIKDLTWTKGSKGLIIQELNRNQNVLSILRADHVTGEIEQLMEEKEDTYLNHQLDLYWLNKKDGFLWLSERDGWSHIYSATNSAKNVKLVTSGDFDVIEIVKIDQTDDLVYFIASPQNGVNRYLYSAKMDGSGEVKRITPQESVGVNSYMISSSGKWAIHTISQYGQPPTSTFISLPNHKVISLIEDNARLKDRLSEINPMPVEYFTASIGDGVVLDYRMIKPKGFDSFKKYPTIFHVYSMPANQITMNRWGGNNYLFHELLANEGFIVITIDGRGTPAPYGKQWRKSIYKKHGILPSDDIAKATKVMLNDHPYMDGDNIGVYGWSGGGLMSLLLTLRYSDLFKVAIPGAYLSHHKLYHARFTERYMGKPQDNPEAFEETAAVNYVENLKGHLLLMHGTGDDNVHYQNTEFLINALIKAQKPFSVAPYPNRNHGYKDDDALKHRYMTYLWYFKQHLQNE